MVNKQVVDKLNMLGKEYLISHDEYNWFIKTSEERTLIITKRDLSSIVKSGNKQRKSWLTFEEFKVLTVALVKLKVF